MNAMTMPSAAAENTLDGHGLASVTFTLNWSDSRATHENHMHVERFSVWREADILPPEIGRAIPGMRTGDHARTNLLDDEILAAWNPTLQVSANPSRFDRRHRRGIEVEPRLGRFYPQGFFHSVRGILGDVVQPARITRLTPEKMEVDLNHPLARFPLQVQFRLDQVLPGFDRRGGRCISPLDDLMLHPGLSAPLTENRDTAYGDDGTGMSRMDERQDQMFYAKPRLIQHLDARALESVNALYRRLIPKQAQVLDFMAAFDSHLQGVSPRNLHVLGMNAEELAVNGAANDRVIQDLNAAPALTCETDSLDAVLCTASIEYLTRPQEILAETLRVLRPDGLLVIAFSNRWFTTKAIRIWSELHEFERVGMVTQWLQQAGFARLNTFSSVGWPRPIDDPYAGKTPYSDPVYAAWGFKPGD